MIDYTFTAGYDYDSLRTYREEAVITRVCHETGVSTVHKVFIAITVFFLTFFLLILMLQNIPAFDIRHVELLEDDIPPTLSAAVLERDVCNTSLFSFSVEHLEHSLNSHPLVQFAQVDRTATGVRVNLSLFTPSLLVQGMSSEGSLLFLARIDGVFRMIQEEDYRFFSRTVPSLVLHHELTPAEVKDLGEQVAQTLLYAEVVSDSLLTNMDLHIPRLRVTIDVREETSIDRLHTALQLIRLGSAHTDESAYSIPSHQRYELSQQSLVQKQRTQDGGRN
ncbi:MAG: hypothetical protein JXK93_03780 [Sphaerochaetaceae bacterium]|nr:hypothetical protein [Sphaerochaetaceae bacterium]